MSNHPDPLHILAYDAAPIRNSGAGYYWQDPWGREHGPLPTRNQAYEQYVLYLDNAVTMTPAAAAREIADLRAGLESLRPGDLLAGLQSCLALSYDVASLRWRVTSPARGVALRRTFSEALTLALEIRDAERQPPPAPAPTPGPDHETPAARP